MTQDSVAQRAQAPPEASPPAQSITYPSPAELARKRAERSGDAADWALVGGLTTLALHGPEHYREMARVRWSR